MIARIETLLPRRLTLSVAACFVIFSSGALIAQNAQPPAPPATTPAPPPAAVAPAPAPAPDANTAPNAPAPAAEPAPQPSAQAPAPPAPPPPPAAPALPPDVTDKIQNVVGTMEGAEKSLTDITTLDQNIGRLRDRVENVIATTTQVADNLRPRLADINSQILQLGPTPEKGQPPEAATVAADRARLTTEASEISGAIKTLELTWVRARQAIDKITDLRLQIFTRSLMERMTSPLFPSLWTDLIDETPPVQRLVTYIVNDWFGAVGRQTTNVFILALLSVLLYAVLKIVARRFTRKPIYPGGRQPSFFERAATASWSAPVRAIPAAATAFFVYAGLDYLGLLYYPSARIAAAVMRGTLIYVSVAHLISAVLSPNDRQFRLVELSDATALRLCRLLKALAAIYAIDLCVTALGRILYFPLSMSVVQSLIASIAFAGVLVGIVLTRFEPLNAASEYPMPRDRPRWLKVPLWLAAAAIIIASLSGYVALGRFAAQQIVMTFVVGLIATLLFLAIRAFTRDPGENGHAVGQMLEERFGIDEPRRRQLAWLTEAALTLTLVIIALPVLLLQWGFSGADIRDWLKSALFGFEIGQFRISLVRILIGIVLFTALLFVTRVVQRHLRDNVLRRPTMDPGIANSVDTAVGYAGTAIAAMLAISYAGLDITNFAIVAGALSVGIGFGLQSIVNNFVSGLILLIERPIKVGDWVVVGGEQGNVRRISVRSTEIETFDRASLIVPNSELISSRVLNWTHRNALGRLIIKISAGPDANPRKVTEILLECANASADILAEPQPLAIFEGFTPTATDFTLRVLLPDISKGLKVQSELRIAIFEALRTADIPLGPTLPPQAPVTIIAPTPQPPVSPPPPFVPKATPKEQT